MSFFHHMNKDVSMELTSERTKMSWPFGDKLSPVSKQIINKRNYCILELNQKTKAQECLFYVERQLDQFPDIYTMSIEPNN